MNLIEALKNNGLSVRTIANYILDKTNSSDDLQEVMENIINDWEKKVTDENTAKEIINSLLDDLHSLSDVIDTIVDYNVLDYDEVAMNEYLYVLNNASYAEVLRDFVTQIIGLLEYEVQYYDKTIYKDARECIETWASTNNTWMNINSLFYKYSS